MTFLFLAALACRNSGPENADFGRRIGRLSAEKSRLLDRIARIDETLAQLNAAPKKETSMKISLVSVPVDDPLKAFEFYTRMLGFVEKTYIPEAQLAVVASPEDPEGTGLLLEPRGDSFAKEYQEKVYGAGLPVIVFGTENIQDEYERLIERGVIFRSKPEKTEWGILALFEDTCGNLIQLHQELKK